MSLELSPLNSVSIEDIFASDPRELTPAHCTQLVTELRRRRSIFRAEEAAKAQENKMRKEIIDAMGLGEVSFNDIQLRRVGAATPDGVDPAALTDQSQPGGADSI